MLKISLLLKKNTQFTGELLEILQIKNAKFPEYYFYINLNI